MQSNGPRICCSTVHSVRAIGRRAEALGGGSPVEIRDYVNVVRRGWAIILVVTLVCAGLAALYTFTRTPLYESRAKVFVSVRSAASIQDLSQSNVFSQQATQDYAQVAVSPLVLDKVIDK